MPVGLAARGGPRAYSCRMPERTQPQPPAGPTPPALEPQMPIIMEILDAFGIAAAGAAGFEAEDVIASLIHFASGRVEIISGDRDLFALVRDPDVVVLYPEAKGQLLVVD